MTRTKIILFGVLLFYGVTHTQAQNFQTYHIYCESIATEQQSDQVRNYFLQQFTEKVTHFHADLSNQTATIVTVFLPVDILQLYKQFGFAAIYLNEEGRRYELTPDNKYLKIIK